MDVQEPDLLPGPVEKPGKKAAGGSGPDDRDLQTASKFTLLPV
jgi:hypothetical protein